MISALTCSTTSSFITCPLSLWVPAILTFPLCKCVRKYLNDFPFLILHFNSLSFRSQIQCHFLKNFFFSPKTRSGTCSPPCHRMLYFLTELKRIYYLSNVCLPNHTRSSKRSVFFFYSLTIVSPEPLSVPGMP